MDNTDGKVYKVIPITEEEATERRKFVKWLTTNFIYKPNRQYRMAPWELFELFKETFPTSTWYEQDMVVLLHQVGYITLESPTLNIEPNIKALSAAQDEAFILKLKQYDWSKNIIRQLEKLLRKGENSRGIINEIRIIEGMMVDPLEVFYELWCMDSHESPTASQFSNDDNFRAIIGNIKEAYRIFCIVNALPEVRWSVVRNFLISKGHKPGRGYANKKPGQSYLRYLYVPGVVEAELDNAAEINQLVVNVQGTYYLSNGTPVRIEEVEKNRQTGIKRIEAISKRMEE